MIPSQQHPAARSPRGFTLVELMVTVALVSVLAAIALPIYSTFIIRSRLVEGIHLAADCMLMLDIHANDDPDSDLSDVAGNAVCNTGLMKTDHFAMLPLVVDSPRLVVIPVQLSATFGNGLSNAQFGWWKDYSQTPARWICGGTPHANTTPALKDYLPSSCQG